MVTWWLAFLPHTKNYLGLNWSFVRSLSVCVRVHSRFHLFCETSATQTRNENVAFPWKCLSTETNMFQKEQLLLYIYTHSYYLSCMSVRLVREEMYLERTHEGFIQPASGFDSRTFMLTANSQSNIIIWAHVFLVQKTFCKLQVLVLFSALKAKPYLYHTHKHGIEIMFYLHFNLPKYQNSGGPPLGSVIRVFSRLEIRWVAYSSVKMQWFNRGPF